MSEGADKRFIGYVDVGVSQFNDIWSDVSFIELILVWSDRNPSSGIHALVASMSAAFIDEFAQLFGKMA